MAKKPTVTTVSSGFASNTQLNSNFTALRDAFDNTLSLDGSTPNAMQADLDLNNNDLLNANSVNTASLRLGGRLVVPSDLVNPMGGGVSVDVFGAVNDGVTDSRAAFTAADSNNVSPVYVAGDYFLSTDTTGKNVSYTLTSDSSVTLGSGSWNPRRYYKDGVTPYDRKVNFAASSPSVPAEDYTNLTDSYQSHLFWINQWGYQEPDTNGDYSGSFQGPFPVGQTRLARTGAYQMYLQGSHSGEGDGYNLYASMSVTPSGATPITFWSGQNSGGVFGFQVNASGAKVNLYGCGDMALNDQGYQDVSLLGNVSILYRDGSDSGSYNVPRFNYLAMSGGANDLDAAYIADGKYVVGLDLSQAVVSSDYAIVLGDGQKIGFAGAAPAAGKFSSASGGTWHIEKSGAAMVVTSDNNPTLQVRVDRTETRPSTETAFSSRVYGSSATAFAAVGQIGVNTYVSAASSGTDNTALIFQTAASGVEAERMRIKSTGVISMPGLPTYADNASALSGGLVANDVYKTATGELRIVV